MAATIQGLCDTVLPRMEELVPAWVLGDDYTRSGSWRIDTVGMWNGRLVLDLFYDAVITNRLDSSIFQSYPATKAIAIQSSQGLFRTVYRITTEPGNFYLDSSRIVRVDGHEILYTRSLESGTGHFYDERYWVWDSIASIPVDIDHERARRLAFKLVMPPDHADWKGGHFDISTLKYSTFTWREGDGNCCPSGGRINIEFAIRSNRLVVKWAVFDHSDVDAIRWVKANDSSYLKQPNVVYIAEPESSRWVGDNAPDYLKQPTIVDEAEPGNSKSVPWLLLRATGLQTDPFPYQRGYFDAPPPMHLNDLADELAAKDGSSTLRSWTADTVGRLNGRIVIEVAYNLDCSTCRDTYGKIVAAEVSPSLYRGLYREISMPGESVIGKNEIFKLEGHTILWVKGNSSYLKDRVDNYWIWPGNTDAPKSLYQDWTLRETLGRISPKYLPQGISVRLPYFDEVMRGSWDVHNLAYSTYTWRESDPDTLPSGGKLRIQFAILNNQLQPVEFTYDSTDTYVPTEKQ